MTASSLIWIALLDLCLFWVLIHYFSVRRRLLALSQSGNGTEVDAQPRFRWKPGGMIIALLCAVAINVAVVHSSLTADSRTGPARRASAPGLADVSRLVRFVPYSNTSPDSALLSIGEFRLSNALYMGNDLVLAIDDSGRPPTLVLFPSEWLKSPDIPDRADQLVFQITYTSKTPKRRRVDAILSSSAQQGQPAFRQAVPALSDSVRTPAAIDSARVEQGKYPD